MTSKRRIRYSEPTPSRSHAAVPGSYTPLRGLPAIAAAAPTPADAAPIVSAPSVAPRPMRERARARAGVVEVLVFRVGVERFGVELAAVEEAIDLTRVHHVPEMPTSMLGVITVRGALTPVYSPKTVLGLPLADGASALIFRRGGSRVAVVIDDVDDVLPIDLAQLRDAPGRDESDGVLLGVVRTADSLLALVDADALLAACQLVPALEIA